MSRPPDHDEPTGPNGTLLAESQVVPRPREIDPRDAPKDAPKDATEDVPEDGTGAALEPGTLVGEYQITHTLGRGGMGIVYGGMHPEIGKRVAIKVLAPHAAVYPDLIRRFKEEARAVNRIRHPNIIDIFAFNQLPDGRHYFVMEYLDGETLTQLLRRGGIELAEKRRLLGQLCAALEAAHAAGVVHRDLKPDNIWVATQPLSESRIKVLDFGIAKLSDVGSSNVTQTGFSMGTPHYMPPEQGMGRAVDHRADIYALGVILYQVFAGVLPFEGGTAQEIVFKHVSSTTPLPSQHRPIVPPGMEAVIMDCLEKDPARRLATMRELGSRIEAAFAAEGAAALPGAAPAPSAHQAHTSPLPIAWTAGDRPASGRTNGDLEAAGVGARRSRKRAVAIAIAGATLVVGGAVVFGGWGRRQTEPELRPAPAPASTARQEQALVAPAAPATTLPPTMPPPPTTAAPAPRPEPAPAADSHHDKRSRRPRREAVPLASAPSRVTAAPGTTPPPAAKPSCDPNFTLDSQGQRHFKPECF